MLRSLMLGGFLLFSSIPAFAGKIAIVDFQRAVAETTEGKSAEKRLQDGMNIRRAELQRQNAEIQRLVKDFEAKQLILNEEARRQAVADIEAKQAKLEADFMRFEQEMQQEYLEVVSSLDTKMRALSGTIAKEKGYDVVLDQSAVIYFGAEVVDMTPELIQRYNAAK
jgi:outer membrane protein